ncbi:MAG: NAD-dependent epimerase/dehydratase family protein [Nitrospinales bacterium]
MNEWKKVEVLITGADGYIGSHLTQRLVDLGADVSITLRDKTRLKNLEPALMDSVQAYDLDILDRDMTKKTLAKIRPRKVFHLAALTSRERDISIAQTMFETNVLGMLNVLTALEKDSYDCFMQFGTAGEYGNGAVPLSESSPLRPNSPYACSKACASLYCQTLRETFGLPIVTVRLFSVYGVKNALPFVAELVRSAQTREPFRMTSGEQTRDFIFIDDAIDAIIKLSFNREAIGQIYNVCSGTETRLRDFALNFNQFLKHPIEIHFSSLAVPANAILRNLGDRGKLKTLTGWEPAITLEQGMKRIIKRYRL